MFKSLCNIDHLEHASEDFVKIAKENEDYRKVLQTTKELQVVAMALKGEEDIPQEIHKTVSQLILIVEGTALIKLGERLHKVKAGMFFTIPSGHYHTVYKSKNDDWLKLLSFYAPPEHPYNRNDKRQNNSHV